MVNDYLMGLMIKGGDMGARLKSIQQVKLDLAAGTAEQDFTINSVDVSKTFVLLGGMYIDHDEPAQRTYTVRLKNATTVAAKRELGSGGPDIRVTIIEFLSGIKSVQRGVTALLGATNDISVDITTVDLTKSFPIFLGCRTASLLARNQTGVLWLQYPYRLRVRNPNKTTSDQWISWEIVEFS